MAAPTVSVVVPAYDRPAMLREALESVLAQTYPAIELIVVDDASPTPMEGVVGPIAPNARVIRHDENRGANAARATGIEAATGDIIAFLDDDDRWTPEKLALQVEAFQEGPASLGVVLVGQRYQNEAGETTELQYPSVRGDATEALLRGSAGGPFSTIAARREIVEAAGLPDPDLPSLQDRDWLIRLSQYCTFDCVPRPLVLRRMGSHAQIGDQYLERRDQTYPMMLEKHLDTARRYGVADAYHASLARGVAGSALKAGDYATARRFALRAVLLHPTYVPAYLYGLAALGGAATYRPAQFVKRTYTRRVRG